MKAIAKKMPGKTIMNGRFEVTFPLGVKLRFYGAPFRYGDTLSNTEFYKVKCAVEQKGRCDTGVLCADFGVPTERDMIDGVTRAIVAAFAGQAVFAGCAGGIGRTGTFLAVVLKALNAEPDPAAGRVHGWVELVRQVYLGHAVETSAQADLISKIDVSAIQRRLRWLWIKAVARKYHVPFFGR